MIDHTHLYLAKGKPNLNAVNVKANSTLILYLVKDTPNLNAVHVKTNSISCELKSYHGMSCRSATLHLTTWLLCLLTKYAGPALGSVSHVIFAETVHGRSKKLNVVPLYVQSTINGVTKTSFEGSLLCFVIKILVKTFIVSGLIKTPNPGFTAPSESRYLVSLFELENSVIYLYVP